MSLPAHWRRCVALRARGNIHSMVCGKGLITLRCFGDMSDQSYWNNFYSSCQGNKHFDWFVRFEDAIEYIEPYLPPVSNSFVTRILEIGCGTSEFSLKLFEHFNRNCRIDCIDFSLEAIKFLRKNIQERGLVAKEIVETERKLESSLDLTGLACHQADAKNMPFADETFSLALDKGTSDAVLKGPKGDVAFADVLHECLRVLKPRGKLIQFSDEPPELRLGALEKVKNDFVQTYSTGLNSSKLRLSWRELSTQSIFQHYLYVVHKEGVGEHR